MELLFILYAALFLIGVWYAFRSGQMHERDRHLRQNDRP